MIPLWLKIITGHHAKRKIPANENHAAQTTSPHFHADHVEVGITRSSVHATIIVARMPP